METIVINIDSNSDKERIIDAVKLLKGVKNVSIVSDEDMENISMLKARKTKKVSKEDVFKAL